MEIKLRKRLIYAGDLWHKTFDCEEPGDFRKAIENAPSVDAVEVVHGRWLKAKDGLDIDRGWKCSNCNNSVYAMTYEPYEYCPHCGANMDGGAEDGQQG